MRIDNDVLQEFIELWDNYHNELVQSGGFPKTPEEQSERRKKENLHKLLNERLTFLSKHFYSTFDLTPLPFYRNFYKWLSQFDADAENPATALSYSQELRFAFILASKLLFFNRPQMLSLANVVWEKVKHELLSDLMSEHNLSVFDVFDIAPIIQKELLLTLFAPLSDSSKFEEFRHVMPDGVHDQITIQHIDILTKPIDGGDSKYLEYLKGLYKEKKSLFIIEDFSGSGTTIIKKISSLISTYSFNSIYFCSLIITERSLKNINDAIANGKFSGRTVKVLYGLKVDDAYSIASSNGDFWSADDARELIRISYKYFNTHFNENGYLYEDYNSVNPMSPTPLGFKNGGYPIVLFTNCPNNSLPIIWSSNSNWRPLFFRRERHLKEVQSEHRKTVTL